MKRISLILAVALMGIGARAEAPSGYYSTCEGKTGQTLLNALYTKITSHTNIGYDALWTLYKTADIDENGKIIDIYSTKRWEPGTEQCGTLTTNIGTCYNREHSIPKSWFNSANPMYADAFHIYPTDGLVNSQRNNYPYGECANGSSKPDYGGYSALGKLGASTFPGYTGTVFEPDDEYKGDLARGYFYMATCYYNLISGWTSDMLNRTSYPAFTDWALQLLLKWHRQDPVSPKELARQEVVYGQQKNRNPFIDHPELVEYIWGNKVGQAWSASALPDAVINMPVEGTVVDCGSVKVGSTSTTDLFINCTNLTFDVALTIGEPTYTEPQTPSEPNPNPDPDPDPNPDNPNPGDNQSIPVTFSFTGDEAYGMTLLEGNANTYNPDPATCTEGVVTLTLNGKTRWWKTSSGKELRCYSGATLVLSVEPGYVITAASLVGATKSNWDITAFEGTAESVTFINTISSGNTAIKGIEVSVARSVSSAPAKTTLDTDPTTYSEDLTHIMMGIQNASNTQYANFTGTSPLGRQFIANAYGKQAYFQLRSGTTSSCKEQCHSGVVSTSSLGDYIRAVHVAWQEETDTSRQLQVFGSNEPYTHPDDLYAIATRGTLLGTINRSDADSNDYGHLTIEGNYKYIGLRSASGALMIYSFTFDWEKAGEESDEPAEPAIFTVSPSTLSAEQANASTTVAITFAPQQPGTYTAPLTITSGGISRTITLTGTGVAGLTATPATNISHDSFTAHWVDSDPDAPRCYMLHVLCNDATLDGFPVQVSSNAQAYLVEDLLEDTDYTYYITRDDEQSNIITIHTPEALPELIVSIDGSDGVIIGSGDDAIFAHVSLFSWRQACSDPATVIINAFKINGDLEVSIDQPFELSTDCATWDNTITIDSQTDHVYLRLRGDNHGSYLKNLTVKAERIEPQGIRPADTSTAWRYINDDIIVHGSVDITTGIDMPTLLTPWEAYTLAGTGIILNRTADILPVTVYTLDGYEITALDVAPGTTELDLPSGYYLIVAADAVRRIVIP